MADLSAKYGTGADLARVLGVDEKMVRKHRDRGLFAGAMTGPDRTPYDLVKCRTLVEANRDPDSALKGLAGAEAVSGRGIPDNSLTRARTAKAAVEARTRQIQLERLQGRLISKADAQAAVRAAITIITERLDGAAAQIGPRVAGNSSAADCEKIARDILHSVRAEIAGMAEAVQAVGASDAA